MLIQSEHQIRVFDAVGGAPMHYVPCFDFLNRIGSQAKGNTKRTGAEHVSNLGRGVHFEKDKAAPEVKAIFSQLRLAKVPEAPP